MSRWSIQFLGHTFHATWANLRSALQENELDKVDGEEIYQEVARLRKVFVYIDEAIQKIDPEIFPLNHLDAINQAATTALHQINEFKGSKNIGNLQNANHHFDAMLATLSNSPVLFLGERDGSLGKAAAAYAATVDEYVNRLREAITKELAELKGKSGAAAGAIVENKKLIESLTQQLNVVAQTIQNQTAEFNKQFQAGEVARAGKFDAATEKLQSKADDEFKELAIKSGTTLKILDKLLEDSRRVYGVVTNTLQAGAYSSYANAEKKTANNLRVFAFFLMVLGVVFLVGPEVWKILHLEKYVFDWQAAIGRVPFSVILFVPAFYLARESGKHRNNEIINRRRELILSTIDPYLVLLDKAKADEIKAEVAKSIFSEGTVANDQSVSDPSNLIAQMTNLIKQSK